MQLSHTPDFLKQEIQRQLDLFFDNNPGLPRLVLNPTRQRALQRWLDDAVAASARVPLEHRKLHFDFKWARYAHKKGSCGSIEQRLHFWDLDLAQQGRLKFKPTHISLGIRYAYGWIKRFNFRVD